MEIPYIEGGKIASDVDWLEHYFRSCNEGTNQAPTALFNERLQRDVITPGINLFLRFTDLDKAILESDRGDVKLETPPVVYASPNEHDFLKKEALGAVWLEGKFSLAQSTGSLVVPNTALVVWVQGGNSHEPTWILKADQEKITRNTLTGEVSTFNHGDLNQVRDVIWHIDDAIFGQEYKKAREDRKREQEGRSRPHI